MLIQKCPAGTICPTTGQSTFPDKVTNPCPAGSYCPIGTSVATPCPVGTYNPNPGRESSSDCWQTPAGFYTLAGATNYLTTPCSAGYFCLAGSSTATQYACPVGTF